MFLSVMIVVFARQLETQQHKSALVLIEALLTELRRLDDKMILTEVHLLESRVYRGIGNLAKAKVCTSDATLVLAYLKSRLIVFVNLCPHCCELDLLPTPTPSRLGLAIRNSTC